MDLISYVCILASGRNGTLHVGVTTDLLRRVHEHRTGEVPGFTSRYGVTRLVWYEEHTSVVEAIAREKSLERWRRAWKLALIETCNPQWLDLWDALHAPTPPPLPPPTVIPAVGKRS
ncbi:MAG: GIY-YIG nuclease family protein [Caulobacteraceae bacterium]|nr:GIY-YIG nuclease family protein [Caulobacteraceae bacterium]